ncbi:MAG: hypothetical protein HRT57_15445 [Crocinitomicaceae bacterium]|nr:hypothetical protein [Crocinitomicaceae bacterium]
MKKYIVYLPIFLLFIATSCSEESNDDPKEQAKEESKKALEDREPQVKEYLDAVDALVGEYFTLAEGMLDSYDKMNEDDLDTFEKIALLADMSSAALEVERLTEELTSIQEEQEEVEAKLGADDIIELGLKISEKMQRYNEIMKRIGEIDFDELNKSTVPDLSSFL